MNNKNQEIKEESLEQAFNRFSEIVFTNLKIYIENYFEKLIPFMKDIEDTKLNAATLSTILASKEIFSKEEFRDCFREIKKSFGEVFPGGIMKGAIEITNYNWDSEKERR